MEALTLDAVRRCMSAHAPMYAWLKPVYQQVAPCKLQRLWDLMWPCR